MIDDFSRAVKNKLLHGTAAWLARRTGALPLTCAGLAIGLGSAVAAAAGAPVVALVLWLLNRTVDGIDGEVARIRGDSSDLGGYLDMMSDVVVYAAIPVALAYARADPFFTFAVLAMVAAFYGNIASWMYLSALLEKRRLAPSRAVTSIVMPGGLIEGTETIIVYALLIAIPGWGVAVALVAATAALIGIVQRVVWAIGVLDRGPT